MTEASAEPGSPRAQPALRDVPAATRPGKRLVASPALIVVLCFLLGITAALGIAHELGAFNSPASKAGPP